MTDLEYLFVANVLVEAAVWSVGAGLLYIVVESWLWALICKQYRKR